MNKKEEKIPRIIHYCWFGRGEKTAKVKKCIESWKKYLGEYQFAEWNEDNFDINSVKYVQQAYSAKKYAFVSDYVRVHALYNYGGIYMDTDVEVIKSLDRFLAHESFWGFEDDRYIATSIIGAVKGHTLIKEMLDHYSIRSFVRDDGSYDMTTNVQAITDMCINHELISDGSLQVLFDDTVFYPRTYFSPYDYINCQSFITDESHTIHHFVKSWLPLHSRMKSKLKGALSFLIGGEQIARARELLKAIKLSVSKG